MILDSGTSAPDCFGEHGKKEGERETERDRDINNYKMCWLFFLKKQTRLLVQSHCVVQLASELPNRCGWTLYIMCAVV